MSEERIKSEEDLDSTCELTAGEVVCQKLRAARKKGPRSPTEKRPRSKAGQCFVLSPRTGIPEETVTLLRDACERKWIPFAVVTAKTFDYNPSQRLEPGDLLYRAATSVAADRVEQFLFRPGVATVSTRRETAFYSSVTTQALMAEAAGIPMPKTAYVASTKVGLLQKLVDRVGGFPVVVKVLGRSSGIGVMMAESMVSLRPLVDFTIAQGHNPLLCQFIRDAVHWRMIVLGGRAIASYRNKQVAGDFRSCGSKDRADFEAVPAAAITETAVRAAAVFGLEFAGLTVLEDPAGKAWFLEANFPVTIRRRSCMRRGRASRDGWWIFSRRRRGMSGGRRRFGGWRMCRDLVSRSSTDSRRPVSAITVIAEAERIEAEQTPGIVTRRGSTGFSFEMPIEGDAALAGIRRRIQRVVGMESDVASTFRFRRYAEGESHRAHLDQYEIEGRLLVATAMLYLTDTERGGETFFPHAQPGPVEIDPRLGRLAVWFNYRAGGQVERAALHSSKPVELGGESHDRVFHLQAG